LITASAFSPCGISSFFEVPELDVKDPRLLGSRGGGFCIEKGVKVKVTLKPLGGVKRYVIKTYMNGSERDLYVAKASALRVLKLVKGGYEVKIEQDIGCPIGCGFGTSGASALATALALSKALNLKLNLWQVAEIAHVVEVECCTGLGTVAGLITGGVVVVKEPGAPREGSTLRIPLTREEELMIVAASFRSVEKYKVLLSREAMERVNAVGRMALKEVLRKPTLETFLKAAKFFTERSGLASPLVRKAIKVAEGRGALVALQNMIGEAVHAVVPLSKVDEVREALSELTPNVIVSRIYQRGLKDLKALTRV